MLLALLSISSCGKHDETENICNHTMLLYFPWSGSTTSGAGGFLSEFEMNIRSIKESIARLGGTGSTRVIIILATSAGEGRMSEVVYKNGIPASQLYRLPHSLHIRDNENRSPLR